MRRPRHLFAVAGAAVAAAGLTGSAAAPAGVARVATATATAIDLGTLGGSTSYGYAVNDSGQVVGYSYTAGDAEYHAFSWTHAGGMVDLGTLGGTSSIALAVNASGQVVGSS